MYTILNETPEAHINRLYQERSDSETPSLNTISLAQLLNQQMSTLFHDSRNFIYELIQNAEDATEKNETNSLTFHFIGDDLIVSHHGKAFRPHDVERICDAARDHDTHESAKSNQAEKIGYKGIGFKSVFGISKDISIISPETNYFFRFSKAYWEEKAYELSQVETDKQPVKFPWQIIPIFVTEEERKKLKTPEENKVSFVLKNINTNKIRQELLGIITCPEILVFLKKIKTIHYKLEGEEIHTLTRLEEDAALKLIRIRHEKKGILSETLWHIHRLVTDVPLDVTEAMQNLDLSDCPEKMKSAKKTEVVFSIPVEAHGDFYRFLPVADGKVFCYLPTKLDCHLPFLINASFVLNQDRTMIMNKPWNVFLLNAIAREQFRWLGEISRHKCYQKSVLNLLSHQDASTIFPSLRRTYYQEAREEHKGEHIENDLLSAYQYGFRRGLSEIPFVLSKLGELLCLFECVIDTTGFFKDIDEQLLGENFSASDKKLVAYDLENRDKLIGFPGVEEYSCISLRKKIEEYMQRLCGADYIAIRSNIIRFLLQEKHNSAFLATQILINTNNQLCAPEKSFLPAKNISSNREFILFDLNIVDTSQYEVDIRNLLEQFNFVEPLTKKMVIKKHVAQLIKNNQIDEKNSIAILQFIYCACVTDESLFECLDHKNTEGINFDRFKVITQVDTLLELNLCFLPAPGDINAQNCDTFQFQLSNHYYINIYDWNIWTRMLSGAGARTKVELKEERISYKELDIRFNYSPKIVEIIKDYAKYVVHKAPATLDGIPSTQRTPKDIEKIIFVDFMAFDFLFSEHPRKSNESNPSEATLRLFIMAINNQREKLLQKPQLNRGIKSDIEICEHFLSYYFREHVRIKIIGQHGTDVAKNLLYSPYLLQLFNQNEAIPEKMKLAHLPIPIDSEIAKHLGFKQHISLEQGLSFLKMHNKSYYEKKLIDAHYFERLNVIYHLLIDIDLTKETEDSKVIIQRWKKKNHLLSQQKEFQLAVNMRVFDELDACLEDQCVTPNFWLNDAGLADDELRKLAEILEIPCHSSKNNDFILGSTDDSESTEPFKQFILNCLPAVASVEAEKFNKSKQELHEMHQKIFQKINDLIFVHCDSIEFLLGYKLRNSVKIKEPYLYIIGERKKTIVRVAKELSQFLSLSNKAHEKFKEAIQFFSDANIDAIKCTELNPELVEWINKKPERRAQYDELMAYQQIKINAVPIKSQIPLHSSQLASVNEDCKYKSPDAIRTKREKKTDEKDIDEQKENGASLKTPDSSIAKNLNRFFGSSPFDPANSKLSPSPVHTRKEKALATLGNQTLEKIFVAEKKAEEDDEKRTETEQKNKEIGDEGERYVFEKIKHLLQTQLDIPAEEKEISILEHNKVPSSRFEKNGKIIDLIWFNKSRGENVQESPVDIVIALNDEIRYFIEVKSTASKTNPLFFLSSNEWQYMQVKREKSVLVRAYNVCNDDEAPFFEVYKNPFEMIYKNLITFMTGGKFRLNVNEGDVLTDHLITEGTEDHEMGCKVM